MTSMPKWPKWGEYLILVGMCCLAYVLTFWMQAKYMTRFDYMPRASLFFIPAGVKLVAFIVSRSAGLVGISLGTLLTLSMDTSWNPPFWGDFVSSFQFFCLLPYLGTLGIMKVLGIDRDLRQMSVVQLMALSVLASVVNGLCINAYMLLEGAIDFHEFNIGTLAATAGDVTGIAFTLLVVSFYPKLVKILEKK